MRWLRRILAATCRTVFRMRPSCPSCGRTWLKTGESICDYWFGHVTVSFTACIHCGDMFVMNDLLHETRMSELERFRFYMNHPQAEWMHDERKAAKRRRLAHKYPEHEFTTIY